jgi:hypothetical protein
MELIKHLRFVIFQTFHSLDEMGQFPCQYNYLAPEHHTSADFA